MSQRTHREPSWKHLYELMADLAAQQTLEEGIQVILDHADALVPADRGVSLIRMDGRIPYCVRWPAYAERLVPLFNSYLNRRSPFYYEPPYHDLPPVDWSSYASSEYHNEFNRPLSIRHTLGVGVRDEWTGTQYAVFVHRGPGGPGFSEADRAVFAECWQPLGRMLALLSRTSARYSASVQPEEAIEGCSLLSPREAEVADLMCRRMTMREIGERLGISRRTVERHALHIYQKLNVIGRRELIRRCMHG